MGLASSTEMPYRIQQGPCRATYFFLCALQIAASSEYEQVFFLLCLENLSTTAGEEGRAECALGASMKVRAQLGAASQAHEKA